MSSDKIVLTSGGRNCGKSEAQRHVNEFLKHYALFSASLDLCRKITEGDILVTKECTCAKAPPLAPDRLYLEAAAEGGYIVWSGGNDYGERKPKFAGTLAECTTYMTREIRKVEPGGVREA